MPEDLQILQKVLEASVERRGEIPLTNAHLLNIVKMTRRVKNQREEAHEKMLDEIYNQVMSETKP